LNQLQDLREVSGTHRESVVREVFKDLLKGSARLHDVVFVSNEHCAKPGRCPKCEPNLVKWLNEWIKHHPVLATEASLH
jgi:hypothetical protein